MKKFNDSHEVYNYYGEILLDQGKFDKAMEYLNKAIEIDPKSSLPYINKGGVFFELPSDQSNLIKKYSHSFPAKQTGPRLCRSRVPQSRRGRSFKRYRSLPTRSVAESPEQD